MAYNTYIKPAGGNWIRIICEDQRAFNIKCVFTHRKAVNMVKRLASKAIINSVFTS
jgi:hypothetical protein